MSITVQCPGCGASRTVDDPRAGHRVTCKQCGTALLVSASAEPPKVRVECEQCGKGHWVSTENAGKKTICKQCGALFRILVGEAAPGRSDSARSSTRRDRGPESPAPVNLDLYGLDEEPTVPPSGGKTSPDASPASTDNDGTAALPSRLKPYKSLSAAKKQKIAKRAATIDKSKASSATVGVSFGAVLAFALIGWRIYRIFNRIERAATRADAFQSAPAEDFVVDPKTMAAEMDKQVGEMIAQPTTAEARDWLDPVKNPNHAVMELPAQAAREMVDGFYERGAEKVYILEPVSVGNSLLTAQIAVRLPRDPARRKRCLAWAAKHEGDEPPAPDVGQKYLLITTD